MTFEEYKQQIADNIATIKQVDGEVFPNLYWFLSRHDNRMLQRLVILLSTLEGIDNQTLIESPNMWAAFASVRHITSKGRHLLKDHRGWHSFIILAVALGLIYRHIPSEKDMGNRYMADSLKRKKNRPINYLGVPAYSQERMRYADKQVQTLRESKVPISRISKEALILIYGQGKANGIYQDNRRESTKNQEISKEMVETAKKRIKEKGFITKDELLKETAISLNIKHKGDWEIWENWGSWVIEVKALYNQRGRGILQAKGIRYHPPSRQEKEDYNLNTGHWIYTK